jgi:hypothetical protein
MSDLILGLSWEQIQDMQSKRSARRTIDLRASGDYGADPIGDGTFRMVPSGDVVDYEERCKRLSRA